MNGGMVTGKVWTQKTSISRADINVREELIFILDTVFKEISYGSLFDYSEKDRWKLILTYDGNYMKILEIEINKEIEVIGPAKSKEELGEFGVKYRYKDNFIHPLISDKLMYGY